MPNAIKPVSSKFASPDKLTPRERAVADFNEARRVFLRSWVVVLSDNDAKTSHEWERNATISAVTQLFDLFYG